MMLNPDKCTFEARVDKLLGFYLTERGIEANPNKWKLIVQMSARTSKKEVQN